MWKVGGIKIESAAGRRFFLPRGHENSWKREIFCKSLRTRKFSMGKFFGASTHGIKQARPQFSKCWFQNICSKMNQRLVIVYELMLICFGSDILKIATVVSRAMSLDEREPIWKGGSTWLPLAWTSCPMRRHNLMMGLDLETIHKVPSRTWGQSPWRRDAQEPKIGTLLRAVDLPSASSPILRGESK